MSSPALDDVLPLPPAAARRVPRPAPRLSTLPGVYAPTHDSWLLAEALSAEPLEGARVLDLCTGSGVLAVTAALAGAEVTAIDVSRRAVLTARLNLRRSGLAGRVIRGDLLRVAPPGTFDVIVCNPPYVPSADDALPRRGRGRAWDGGRDGRAVIDRICAEAPSRLGPGGRLVMVHSHVADLDRTVQLLGDAGLAVDVAADRRLSFGPVMRRRAALLHDRGLIDRGDHHERIAVLRAVAPGAPGGRA